MLVNIQFTGYYTEIAKVKDAVIELDDNSRDTFKKAIIKEYPDMAEHLDEATLIVNGETILQDDGLLADGDQVFILIPLAGG